MRKSAFILALFLVGCGAGAGGGSDPGTPPAPPAPPGPPPGPGYAGSGTGTHYWIDIAAGSNAWPGSQAQPWATVDRIETATFAPGDLIHVRPGLYNLNNNLALTGITGNAGAWIGIQAEGSVTLRNSSSGANVIDISNCHFLFLKGFEITHDNGGAAYSTGWAPIDGVKFQNVSSDNVSIDGCTIHELGNVGISSQAALVQYISVVNCQIYNCYTGLYWGYYEDVNKRYAHYGRIAHNYIHDCPPVDLDGTGYGIQIKGGSRGNIVEDNVMVNCAGNTRAAIAVYHVSTNVAVSVESNIIRRNFIRASRNEGIYAVEGAIIENNVVMDSNVLGINVGSRNTGYGVFYGNLQIRNNTVYRVTSTASGRAIYVDSATGMATVTVANNVCVATGGGSQYAMRCPAAFTGTSAQNFCVGPVSNFPGTVATTLSAFQNTAYGTSGFLVPALGGVLVNSGQGVLASADDFGAVPRDATPDVGAFEITGTAPWVLQDGFKP